MAVGLTSDGFDKLLLYLDADRERAGEKYEDLRRTLLRYFECRGAPFPEEYADEVLNRISRKLVDGVEIKNSGAYSYEVARLVFLETTKHHDRLKESLESVTFEPSAHDSNADTKTKEQRSSCLEECLRKLPAQNANLILEYYRYEEQGQIAHRKNLANRLGLRREALNNRVQRLRDKLQYCVAACLKKNPRYES
jgi:DNA-directed RNA polymerase specialized sigma24 family protein